MQYSSNIELRQLEQGLEQIVDQHQERLERWVAPVAKHVKKYGLPIMYVGHVDLAFNHEYTPGKIYSSGLHNMEPGKCYSLWLPRRYRRWIRRS